MVAKQRVEMRCMAEKDGVVGGVFSVPPSVQYGEDHGPFGGWGGGGGGKEPLEAGSAEEHVRSVALDWCTGI